MKMPLVEQSTVMGMRKHFNNYIPDSLLMIEFPTVAAI